MAVKVSSVDTFKQAMLGCIELEKTKRGLGKLFHAAVIDLLNENPGLTGEELSALFLETMTEVENTLRSELVEAFGEDFDLKEAMPSWTQYKSDYKQAMLKVDRRDLIKCGGVADVKKKLNEVRKALKEKEEAGLSDGAPADSKAETTTTSLDKIPAAARPFIEEALNTMARLSDADAAELAMTFRNKTSERVRRLGQAKKKIGATAGAGSSDKVAANH